MINIDKRRELPQQTLSRRLDMLQTCANVEFARFQGLSTEPQVAGSQAPVTNCNDEGYAEGTKK
jgi:hypothetical protein